MARGTTPVQSLASLEWYREAFNEGADGRGRGALRWLRGWPFLRAHISLYALAIVALFALNLVRSPGSLWIDNVALAWAALLVVHAACAGLIWAIGLLRESEREEARDQTWAVARLQAPRNEPQEAEYRMAVAAAAATAESTADAPIAAEVPTWQPATPTPTVTPTPPSGAPEAAAPAGAASTVEPSPPAKSSPWSGWEPRSPADIAREAEASQERASWKEAAAAAWLARDSDVTAPDTDPFTDRGNDAPPTTNATPGRDTRTS